MTWPVVVLALGLWLALLGAPALHAKSPEQDLIRQALQAGQLQEGAKLLKAELQRQPRDVNLRLLEGVLQAQSGQKDKAIETFKKIAVDHPALPEAHNNLGVLYAERQELALAKAAFERALATIPSYAASHKNLMDLNALLARQAYARAFRQDDAAAKVASAASGALRLVPVVGGAPLPDARPASAPLVTAQAKGSMPLAQVPAPIPPPAPAPAAVSTNSAASAAAASASGAPSTAPAASPGNDAAAIDKAIKDWASAWSKKNVTQYLEAYSANFEPANRQSRQSWAKDRRVRIEQRKFIRVSVSRLQIDIKGKQAQVRLEQSYESDGPSISSRKTLDLVNEGGRWLILREKAS